LTRRVRSKATGRGCGAAPESTGLIMKRAKRIFHLEKLVGTSGSRFTPRVGVAQLLSLGVARHGFRGLDAFVPIRLFC
jgi:hypothetical protein